MFVLLPGIMYFSKILKYTCGVSIRPNGSHLTTMLTTRGYYFTSCTAVPLLLYLVLLFVVLPMLVGSYAFLVFPVAFGFPFHFQLVRLGLFFPHHISCYGFLFVLFLIC